MQTQNQPAIKVFLIGMMGSGKTFWAERLKKQLKVPAYDLDNLIELMDERSIAEMFDQSGEEYFRKEEAKMLRLFKEKKQFILSCGGGTPCFSDNMSWMNKNGITIWLDEPIEILAERLNKEKDHRPLIRKLKTSELVGFLNQKLNERLPNYQLSKYRLTNLQITESNLLKIIKQHA
jgi:shikimate kinase